MKNIIRHTLYILLMMMTSCILSMEEFIVPEDQKGKDEPCTEVSPYGEVTYQYHDNVTSLNGEPQGYIAMMNDSVIWFMDNMPDKWVPKEGHFIAANCSQTIPLGLCAKVRSVFRENGMIRVEYEPAEKEEVFKSLEIRLDFEYIIPGVSDFEPDSIEIEEAYNSLRQADRLKKEIEGAHAQLGANKPRPHLAILSAVLLCIGALLSAIAFLPSLRTLLIPALVAGCALLVTGAILSILASAKKRQYRSLLIQAEQTEKSREAEVRRLIGGVGEMLAAYGWHPASEEDLARGLGELSAQSFSYWEAQKKVNRTEEERRAVSQAVNTLSARLHTVFSSFHEDLPYKADYRAELDLLYRELDKLSELESLARAHATERARAEQVLRERQAALLPFLHRFDPAGKMRAGECLNYVSEQYAEFCRLGREIDEKRAAMAAFVAEKKLDTAPASVAAGSYRDADPTTQNRVNFTLPVVKPNQVVPVIEIFLKTQE